MTTRKKRPRTGARKRSNPKGLRDVQEQFLEAFRNTGTVTGAAMIIGIDRRDHYQWLDRGDERYRLRFAEEEDAAVELCITEAIRRGRAGVERFAGFYQGEPITVKDPKTKRRMPVMYREYSDNLLMFVIKARRPEFRDKLDVKATGTVQMDIGVARQIAERGREYRLEAENKKAKT